MDYSTINQKELTKLQYKDAEIGMHVVDEDGNAGFIKEIQDEHKVFVKLDKEEQRYCLVEECNYYDPLFIIDNNG